jgi:outer membrane protein OmpA-like peptidoglycan-associated protein
MITGFALATATGTGPLFAQSPYGMERARAVGELTHEAIAQALQDEGRVSMSGGFFEFDKADLTQTSSEVLFKVAKAMESIPELRMVIVGHTDATGDFNYNLDLSQRRADAVRNALLGEPYNVEAERLVALGVGQIAPVASNKSEEGQALNRRVEFIVITN